MIRRRGFQLLKVAATLACLGSAITAPSPALAAPRPAKAMAGPNLLLNPGAQAGAFSAAGWDAVTIPGWHIISGLPTVVRYGTARFPRATGQQPAVRGGQLFAGGAGGTARLQQVVTLSSTAGTGLPARTDFRLSAFLGA